jgi:uncharacterized membrane protein (DUF2068 family)
LSAQHNPRALRVIAVYKFVKATALLIVASVAFGLLHEPFLDAAAHWLEHLPIQNGRDVLQHLADELTGTTPRRFIMAGFAAIAYAALFTVEGFGLWNGKRWAEYLTIIATASLIPFELWELARHPTPSKTIVLVVNVAIVIYLWHLLHRKADASASPVATPPAP